MDRIAWDDAKVAQLRELCIRGRANLEIARILSTEWKQEVTYKQVDGAKTRFGMSDVYLELNKDIKIYEEATLPDDDYMISCDHHSPHYSELWVNRYLMIARFFGIKKQIIAGDLFNMGFAKKWASQEGEDSTSLDIERMQSDPLVNALRYFDETFLIRGNHESRVTRITEARIQASHIIELFGKALWDKKFKYSVYDKVKVGEDYLIIHPKSYSQISGSVAVRMAEKHHRHILNAHGHFVALRYERSGKYMAVDLGGMFDIKKIDYINLSSTTHPTWNNGFAMIRKGKMWHFHERTDWKFWQSL